MENGKRLDNLLHSVFLYSSLLCKAKLILPKYLKSSSCFFYFSTLWQQALWLICWVICNELNINFLATSINTRNNIHIKRTIHKIVLGQWGNNIFYKHIHIILPFQVFLLIYSCSKIAIRKFFCLNAARQQVCDWCAELQVI